jgi:ribonuclease Z
MFAVTLLGTSASVPSADRNHPGLLVEAGGDRILVDCGEGTQRQLLRSGAGFRRLDRLLLTHAHFDHVLGIPSLLSTLRLQQSADTMAIHGGPGTLEIIARMLAVLGRGNGADLAGLRPLSGRADRRRRPIHHRLLSCTDSFGFAFESQVRRHVLPDRLSALGVPDGPVRKVLAEGTPATLEDGRTIDPEDVLGPPAKAKKLVVVGDTETTDGLSKHVRNADVLVIEATFLDRDSEMARDYGHLTAAKAAALALESNVKQLFLNHISGRYPEEEILAEAAPIFPDSRVAGDFDRFVV